MKLKRLFSSRNRLGKVKRQLFRGALHVSIYSEQTKLRIRKLHQVLDRSTCVGLSLESVKSPLSRSTRSCTLRKCSFGFRCSRNCRPNLSPYVSPRGLVSRKRREELSQLLSFDKSGARVFSTSREMIVDDYEQPRWKGKSFGLIYRVNIILWRITSEHSVRCSSRVFLSLSYDDILYLPLSLSLSCFSIPFYFQRGIEPGVD